MTSALELFDANPRDFFRAVVRLSESGRMFNI